MISGGNPFGNTGKGRSSTMPIISQWPVTESFPGDASAMRPIATGIGGPDGLAASEEPAPSDATRPSPRARSVGSFSGTRFAMLPSVSLP